ncbi:MAG: hypothetical protein ACOVT5_00470, partial [Armatimonadaceae bacterium]
RELGTDDAGDGAISSGDDPELPNGFLLNCSHWTVAQTVGFLTRRIAPQPAPPISKKSTTPRPIDSGTPAPATRDDAKANPVVPGSPKRSVDSKKPAGATPKPAGRPSGGQRSKPKR